MAQVTGLDLIHLGTVAGQEQLVDPSVSQPLAAALTILVGEELLAGLEPHRIVVAGHGVGEIAAAVVAGVLSEEAGLSLAMRLGQAQSAVAAGDPSTGLVAVLGGYPPDVERRVTDLGLSVAAYNGAGNIVVAGSRSGLDALLRHPPTHVRAEPLPARCACYCPAMSDVAGELRDMLRDLVIREPAGLLISGWDGQPAPSGQAFLHKTMLQLTGPVHWDSVMAGFEDAAVEAVFELPPAGVLSGYVVRAVPGLGAVPLRTPQDLADATRILASP